MKKLLLNTFTVTCLTLSVQAQTTHTITISGLTYVPASLTINESDKVIISASGNHPLLEVSKATYDSDGNTALAGGFSGTTAQTITFSEVGDYYFVCTRHSDLGMKGMIKVVRPTGLFNETSSSSKNGVKIYPNPAASDLMIQLEQATIVQNISLVNAQGIEVSNQAINSSITSHTLNVSGLESGLYQVVISTPEKKIYNKVVVR
jgi:plastocyanin